MDDFGSYRLPFWHSAVCTAKESGPFIAGSTSPCNPLVTASGTTFSFCSLPLCPYSGDECRVLVIPQRCTRGCSVSICIVHIQWHSPGRQTPLSLPPPTVQTVLFPQCCLPLMGIWGSCIYSQLISRRPALSNVPPSKGARILVTGNKQL